MTNIDRGLADSSETFAGSGIRSNTSGPDKSEHNRKASAVAYLNDHIAVKEHGENIQLDNLVSFQESFSSYAASRLRGVGADQYSKDGQAFEKLTPDELVDELLDELADIINYCSFMAIKVMNAVSKL